MIQRLRATFAVTRPYSSSYLTMSLSENSPKDISNIRAANLPSHWSRCLVPCFTRMFDPLRNSIFSFPIWTRTPLSRATQNSFLCLWDCRLVHAPGLIVRIFTVERSFNVYWSNDPHGFLTCFNSIPRGIIFTLQYLGLVCFSDTEKDKCGKRNRHNSYTRITIASSLLGAILLKLSKATLLVVALEV